MSGGRACSCACWCEWSAEHAGVSGGRACWCEWSAEHAGVSGVQSMLV